jgi:protein-disulfide isomerase
LTIGLVALVVVLALVFAITRHNNNQESATPEVAASVPVAPDKKAGEAKPAADTKDSDKKADPASGDELTSSTDENAEAKNAEPAKKDDKADDKKDDKPDSKAGEKDKSAAHSDSLLAAPSSLEIDIEKAMAERSIGKEDAPVTMIEYASLTCPHCAHFSNDLLPKLKPLLIDTGKVRLIFRDYPLDSFAMKAALMARCADPDKYFDLIEVIFKNQERWVKNADPVKGLTQLGALAGMNEDFIKACMANEELQSSILSKVQDAQKNYKLNSTPTFVFNNGAEIMSGDKEVEDFVNVVKKLTGK